MTDDTSEKLGAVWLVLGFASTDPVGDAWFIATGNLFPFSVQQLVDSDTVVPFCNGDLIDNAFALAEESTTCTDVSDTCIATKGTCKDSSCNVDIIQGSVTRY